MTVTDSDKTTLYNGDNYTFKALGDNHQDDYSLAHGGLYVEFSDVRWADMVWLLVAENEGAYMSVRHSTGKSDDVPKGLDAMLEAIHNGRDPLDPDREFAYGSGVVEGVKDPLMAAQEASEDFNPDLDENPWYQRIADQYDTYVQMHLYEEQGGDYSELRDPPTQALKEEAPELVEGIIPEYLARRLWFKAAEAQQGMNTIEGEGYEVAEALGWL